jgi:iron complex transport system substrate-binding protein
MMRMLQSGAAAALLVTTTVGMAVAGPPRVMSLNLCSDQLVLQLVPADRITSVSWLARDPEESMMAHAAAAVPINHGAAEEVVRDHPDLVIAGTYATPAARRLLKKLGFPLLEIGATDSFEDISRVTRQVAAAVGESARGERLLAHMDAVLAELNRHEDSELRVAAWDSAGFSATPGSLFDTLLLAAGARNVANETGANELGTPDVEGLLASAPALLVRGMPGFQKPGLHDDAAFHPLVRRFWQDRTVYVAQSSYLCGSPLSADAALSLQAQMANAMASAKRPLPFQAAGHP